MSRNGDGESRPTKRPRILVPPDGFHKRAAVPSQKIRTQKFTSGFDPAPVHHHTVDWGHPVSGGRSDPPKSTIRHLKPPLLVATEPKPGQSSKRITSYQPVSRDGPSDKPLLRKVPPPPPLLVPNKTPVPMKTLAPPVLQVHTPKREMKTISTTRVARATDPMTDSGHAELLSIFLRDQHHLVSSYDRELNRGIFSSPEKGVKGKGPRFLRNGLAEHASQILSTSHTAFSLWQRETETLLTAGRLNPDLRLLVMKVLHITKPLDRSRSSSAGRSAITLCRVLFNKNSAEIRKDETCLVLLSSPSHTSDTRIGLFGELEENRELCVWQPWHQVELPSDTAADSLNASDCVGDGNVGESGTRVALLCSRFLVNRT